MSRIVFVTLAVLSLLLAFVFSKGILYALALLFVGLAVVQYLVEKRREFFPSDSSGKSAGSLSTGTTGSSDDLRSLGILDIKPKAAGRSTVTEEKSKEVEVAVAAPGDEAVEEKPERPQRKAAQRKKKPQEAPPPPESEGETARLFQDEDAEHIPFKPGEEVSAARPVAANRKKKALSDSGAGEGNGSTRQRRGQPIKAKPRADENYVAVQEAQDENLAKILVPCLISLRAAINAHTICVLSYRLDTTKYSIVGVVSKNGYARTSGSFISPVPLVSSTKNRNTVEVMHVGPGGLLEDAVGYYRENIAVRSVATARIYASSESERYLLLADSFDERFVGDATSCRLFDRYAQVIGPMLDMHFGADSDEFDGSRPRREIIADEISNARAASKDLALALVYLNNAEDVSAKSKDEISRVEEELDKLLRRSTDKGRVEHFGELTFGVLYRGTVNDVERWAIRVQNEVSKGDNGLSAGVSVGVAMLTDRHLGPDELRTDASTALEEALETGACTILE